MTDNSTLFMILVILFLVIISVLMILPFFINQSQNNDLLTLNIALFKQRLAELEADNINTNIEPADYLEQKTELQRQLLNASDDLDLETSQNQQKNHKLVGFILFIFILLATSFYLLIDNRTPVFKWWQTQTDASIEQVATDLLTGSIQQPPDDFYAEVDDSELLNKRAKQLLYSMQAKTHQHADNAIYWFNLAKSYMALQENVQALESLSRAYRLAPNNQQIAMTYAQRLFFANNGQLDKQIRVIANDILTQNPKHEGAQMLMAMGEIKAANFAAAGKWVNRLKHTLIAKQGTQKDTRHHALASLEKLSRIIANQQQKLADTIQANVKITPALIHKININAVLFVYIKADSGAPYAVKRLPVRQLLNNGQSGMIINLTDSDNMLPSRTISEAKRDRIPLFLMASISKTGNAIVQKGDFVSKKTPLNFEDTNNTYQPYQLLIDQMK